MMFFLLLLTKHFIKNTIIQENFNKKVAGNIKNFREFQNFTQEYMAETLNVDIKTYRGIEKGETKITLDLLEKIAQILGTTIYAITKFDSGMYFNIKMKDQSKGGYINHYHESQEVSELKMEIKELKSLVMAFVAQK